MAEAESLPEPRIEEIPGRVRFIVFLVVGEEGDGMRYEAECYLG